MTEQDELLARIGRLAGQINRHKSQDTQTSNHQSQYASGNFYPHSRWEPYSSRGRGGGRGRGRGRGARHCSLVLNNQAVGSNSAASSAPTSGSTSATVPTPAPTSTGWVAKRNRHNNQLINSAIYDREIQARSKAMEETRKLKEKQAAEREQAKVLRYAQGAGAVATILVNDIPFKVARGGSKLVRVSNDPSTANNTPKRVTVAGVSFVRSKNGNLHRLRAVASKQTHTVKKRDELCKRFTTTGILFSDGPILLGSAPSTYSRLTVVIYVLGTCYKGPNCPFIHDPTKVAICKDFLMTGKCAAGTSCDLSHEPSPHRSPACMHFLRGRCANPECRYSHVRVTPGAPVCRAFATLGYCEKGETCEEKHVHECPDYANTGACDKKRCKLPHVDRAGQIRKAAAAAASKNDITGEESDPSSEDESYDAIDSDDVDSDDESPEEIIEGVDSGEMSEQQDFIHV
ncbi:hypothetical protein N7535_008143 [Penicillium sp. DV-2018c]|nr:hypothetical protein N7461_004179 [Penicillium sp. DV-2018c]KAJ5566505.1 hypothetical protein N7535_008143 [Penicillium sp. DV-2018c]